MNDDIQFGEVETARPQKQLRPDQNKHFAVVAYGTPRDGELPIFVDLDVVADMELHAESDTSVELGGVLLGAHCEDEDGNPFVLITDSLRAEHYHSTKGSFTFTHDTWAAITRRRDEFPAELAMAGWYHTHPDWGVFLSGMDMFICDNFFNKRLDVAYVIDPCRGDRAFFQWTGDSRHRKKRVGGFYVVASRFRQQELELYVQQLEGKGIAMPATTSGYPGPIIHVPQPPPQPAWQPLAVIGMLALQFCFLALIAWKMIGPPIGDDKVSDTAALVQKLDAYLETRDAEVREAAQQRVYDRILRELKGAPDGTAAQIAAQEELLERARTEGPLFRAREQELVAAVEDGQKDIDALKNKLDEMTTTAKSWQDKHERLLVTAKEQQTRLKSLENKPEDEKGEAAGTFLGIRTLWWVIGGSIVVLGAVAWGLTYVAGKKPDSSLADDELVPPPPPRAKNETEAAN